MMKNKWRWGGLLAVAILAVWWLWPRNKPEVGGEKTWENQRAGEAYTDSYMPVELGTPKEVEWKVGEIEGPKKVGVWWYETSKLTTMVAELLKEVGMTSESKNQDDGVVTAYDDGAGRTIYVDSARQELEYVLEISDRSQLMSETKKEVGKIKDDLEEMLSRINGTKVTMKWEEARQVKMIFPRWVEVAESEAEAMEIKGDYWLQGKKIKTFYGNSVAAIVRSDGVLLKLIMTAIPVVTKMESESDRTKVEDLKYRKLETIGVVRTEGGVGFENKGEMGEIGKIVINQAELVTIMDTRGGRLRSYYWLSGSARSGQPLKVELVTGAR